MPAKFATIAQYQKTALKCRYNTKSGLTTPFILGRGRGAGGRGQGRKNTGTRKGGYKNGFGITHIPHLKCKTTCPKTNREWEKYST
jgi:hypothetical protein